MRERPEKSARAGRPGGGPGGDCLWCLVPVKNLFLGTCVPLVSWHCVYRCSIPHAGSSKTSLEAFKKVGSVQGTIE